MSVGWELRVVGWDKTERVVDDTALAGPLDEPIVIPGWDRWVDDRLEYVQLAAGDEGIRIPIPLTFTRRALTEALDTLRAAVGSRRPPGPKPGREVDAQRVGEALDDFRVAHSREPTVDELAERAGYRDARSLYRVIGHGGVKAFIRDHDAAAAIAGRLVETPMTDPALVKLSATSARFLATAARRESNDPNDPRLMVSEIDP